MRLFAGAPGPLAARLSVTERFVSGELESEGFFAEGQPLRGNRIEDHVLFHKDSIRDCEILLQIKNVFVGQFALNLDLFAVDLLLFWPGIFSMFRPTAILPKLTEVIRLAILAHFFHHSSSKV